MRKDEDLVILSMVKSSKIFEIVQSRSQKVICFAYGINDFIYLVLLSISIFTTSGTVLCTKCAKKGNHMKTGIQSATGI